MFDPSILWTAFEAAGLLVEATHQPASGDPVVFQCGFRRPDAIVLDGMAQATDYSIEYQTSDVSLKRGATVTIGGAAYKVRQPPSAAGDGFFTVALLEKS